MVLNHRRKIIMEDLIPENLTHGTRVRVRESMYHTGRIGILAPISDDPEDCWEFYVELEATATKPARTIGVYALQVVPV
jgi:hypothetical protein